MPLYRLLYKSAFALRGDARSANRQIDDIVADAALDNLRSDLSGALIASNGIFIQVLEGPLSAIEITFEKICTDLRHRHVQLIELAPIDERLFARWQMVRVDIREEMLPLLRVFDIALNGLVDMSKTESILELMRSHLTTTAVTKPPAYDAPNEMDVVQIR